MVVLGEIGNWLANPEIHFTAIHLKGILPAILATIQILILGTIASHAFLKGEDDKFIKRISAIGLGLGLTGFTVILLAMFGVLYRIPLNLAWLFLVGILLTKAFSQAHGNYNLKSVWTFLKDAFLIWKFERPVISSSSLLIIIPLGGIFLFIFYHALLTPVTHWDATVYHATMAKVMYYNHAFPLIAGHSVGIQMSANYPPLFPGLGAYFYTQIGGVDDFYLRAISPIMALLTILATYKVGKVLAGNTCGKVTALLLSMTPLFILYSIYAINYTMLTFFVITSVLFLLLALTKKNTVYWVMCGVFYGLAMLTSYQALVFFLPSFALVLLYLLIRKGHERKFLIRNTLLLGVSALVIGGIWYLRNTIVLGNPVYPFLYGIFGGKYIDPAVLERTFSGIHWCSVNGFFGKLDPGILERVDFTIFNRSLFPLISVISILGIALVVLQKKRELWMICLAFCLVPLIIISTGVANIFPRYFLFALPGFALICALPIVKVFEKSDQFRRGYLIKAGIIIVMVLTLIFPTSLAAYGGKGYSGEEWKSPLPDYLLMFTHPGEDPYSALEHFYGGSPRAWGWLNERLKEGEKVGTFENKIYYIKDGSPDYFFYLDGWESQDLYHIYDPENMVQYFGDTNVGYILEPDWIRSWAFYNELPLNTFLGSPYFPVVFEAGDVVIYNVGPIYDPITVDSPRPISISGKGWSDVQILNGREAKSVLAGSTYPRLAVAALDLTLVGITYLDKGTDRLSLHLFLPQQNEWIHDYVTITKQDSGEWKTFQFLVPIDSERRFIEFGLHAYNEDFTINRIEAVPFQAVGKVSLASLSSEITNTTNPPTLMVYLPLLKKGGKIMVETDSHSQNIRVELFEGIIQPWELSGWCERHIMVAGSPSLPIYGKENPSLICEIKGGCYTLVIVLWDEYQMSASVDLTVVIAEVEQNE